MHYVHYVHNVSPKHGIVLNTCNDFIRSIFVWRHVSGKITSGVAMRGDSGVAGEGRVVGEPKFHSWGKCTMKVATKPTNSWPFRVIIELCDSGSWIMKVDILASHSFAITLFHVYIMCTHWRGCTHTLVYCAGVTNAHSHTNWLPRWLGSRWLWSHGVDWEVP